MQETYPEDRLREIGQTLSELRNGRLGGLPVASEELAFFQKVRHMIGDEELESWHPDPPLLIRIQSALSRHGRAAHELKIGLLEWFLQEDEHALVPNADRRADIHRLLGEAYVNRCELGDGSSEDLDTAGSHCLAALKYYTKTQKAEDAATMHHQLALIYDMQGKCSTAIDEFRNALAVYPTDISRKEWAEIQLDLAMTLLKGDEPNAPEEAIHHLELGLNEARGADLSKLRRALIEGLGLAYQYRAYGDELQNVRVATQYFSTALGEYDAIADDCGCARMCVALGEVWLRRTALEEGDFIQVAIDHFNRAQSFYTETANPYEWANLERQIGSALAARKGFDNRGDHQCALQHFRNAIRVYQILGKQALVASVSKIVKLNEEILRIEHETSGTNCHP